MKKRGIIIISICVLLVLLALGSFVFMRKNETGTVNLILPDGESVDRFFTDNEEESAPELLKIDSFRQIRDKPVSGFHTFKDSENRDIIRFVDRGSGNIFEFSPNDSLPRKIVSFTFPKTQEALFVNKDTVILRALNDEGEIRTTVLFIEEKEGTYSTDSILLENNIRSIDASSSGNIAYIRIMGETPELVLWNSANRKIIKAIPLPLREWSLQLLSNNDIYLTTNPAYGVSGYTYKIPSASSVLTPVLRKVPGLTFLSNDGGTAFAYSSFGLNQNTFNILERGSDAYSLTFLSFKDKCSWENGSTLYCASVYDEGISTRIKMPDDWHKGKVTSNGSVFSYTVGSSNPPEFIFSDPGNDIPFDVTHIKTTPSGNKILFINKNDLSLWEYNLENSNL